MQVAFFAEANVLIPVNCVVCQLYTAKLRNHLNIFDGEQKKKRRQDFVHKNTVCIGVLPLE